MPVLLRSLLSVRVRPAARLLVVLFLASLLLAPGARAQTITPIHAVQGSGEESPLEGQVVTVEGVVVGDFQPGDGDLFGTDLGGFFVQEEESDADDDPETSEGLFVFTGGASVSIPDVVPGDLVRVTGEVTEFFGLTELTSVSLLEIVTSAPLPAFTDITFPLTARDVLERYEGMRVRFPQPLVIAEYAEQDFVLFGQIGLAFPPDDLERPFQPTSYVEPGPPAEEVEEALDLRRITLDDARTGVRPDTLRHPNGQPFTLDNLFRGGDRVGNTVGVLSYGFGRYRIQPTEGADYIQANPRSDAPDDVGGALKVAAFNALNYFLTLDTAGANCGPDLDQNCRGADTEEEFMRQRDKLLSALEGLDADVIGLVEVENTTGVEPLADLAEGLNERLGAGTYAFVDAGTIGGDAIKVGLLYRPEAVAPVGPFVTLTEPAEIFIGERTNRVPLAQTFEEVSTGERVTVVVNHFKSKSASGLDDECTSPDVDPNCDQGDGQGFFNERRTRAAEALVAWLATDPTGSGDEDHLIIGDLNAYDEEDPIDAIKAGPDGERGTSDDYAGLLEDSEGEFAYSYVFGGQFGHLDYALSSAALTPQVTGTTAWHINADEPDLLSYEAASMPVGPAAAFYEPGPYRASDHDPVLAGLSLGAPVADATPPVCGEILVDRDAEPPSITTSATDAESGIASITYTRLENLDGFYAAGEESGAGLAEGTVVAFDADEVEEVSFGGTLSDPEDRRVAIVVTVENGAGLTSRCDPVVSQIDASAPAAFALEGSYPNPTHGATTIRFAVAEASDVTLDVYDVLGRKVATLVDEEMAPGTYRVEWSASGLPSGTYVYRMRAGAFTAARQLVLVK